VKRTVSLLLMFVALLSLFACSKSDGKMVRNLYTTMGLFLRYYG